MLRKLFTGALAFLSLAAIHCSALAQTSIQDLPQQSHVNDFDYFILESMSQPAGQKTSKLLASDLANYMTTKFSVTIVPILTGDVTTNGSSNNTTLATVNASPGTFGSATQVPVVTVNAKGLVTSVSLAAVVAVADAGALTGTTLASNVTASSLTSLGTLTALNVNGPTTLTALNVSGSTSLASLNVSGATTLASLGVTTLNATTGAFQSVTISTNAAALPAGPTGTLLHVGSADSNPSIILADSFANLPAFIGRKANGTAAAPLAVGAAINLATFQGAGYDGSAWSAGQAYLSFRSQNAWTPTDHSTFGVIVTTPSASLTPSEVIRFQASGGVSIGNAAFNASDPGAGNVWVQNSLSTAGSVNASGGGAFGSLLVTANTAPLPAGPAGTLVHTGQADGAVNYFVADAFSGASVFMGRRSTGTAAAPTANGPANTGIVALQASGYDGTVWTGPAGNFVFRTANTWSATDHSTQALLLTTPIGSIVAAEVIRFQASGGVSIGNSAFNGTDPGAGNLAVQGNITGNVPVADLNAGTGASSTTFWRGDGTWATPAGGGGGGGSDPGSISNCTIGATVSGNALTVSLLTQAGATPSAGSPCIISFRNATLATGDYTAVSVTAATQFVTGATGSTFGAANAAPFRLWVTAWNNGGTVALGLSLQSAPATGIFPLNEDTPQSTTACAACTTANAAGVFYTPSALSAKAMRILGYMEWSSGLTTAGVWATGPTKRQLAGPGTHKPGDTVQAKWMQSQTDTNNTTTSYVDTTTTLAITPTAAVDFVLATYYCGAATDVASTKVQTALRRGGAVVGVPSIFYPGGGVGLIGETGGSVMDNPGSTSAQTYTVGVLSGTAANNVHACGVGSGGSLQLQEIMT